MCFYLPCSFVFTIKMNLLFLAHEDREIHSHNYTDRLLIMFYYRHITQANYECPCRCRRLYKWVSWSQAPACHRMLNSNALFNTAYRIAYTSMFGEAWMRCSRERNKLDEFVHVWMCLNVAHVHIRKRY